MKKIFALSVIVLCLSACGNKAENTDNIDDITVEEETASPARVYTPEEKQMMEDIEDLVGETGTNIFNYKLGTTADKYLPYASRKYSKTPYHSDIVYVADYSVIKKDKFKVEDQVMHYDQQLTNKMLNGKGGWYVDDPIYKLNDSARINEIQTRLILDPHFNPDTVAVLTEKVLANKGFKIKRKAFPTSSSVLAIKMEKGDTLVEITVTPEKRICYNIYIYNHDRIFESYEDFRGYGKSRVLYLDKMDSIPESQFPH